MDTLKNFISSMTDAISHQVTEQANRAMKEANSARPLPHLDYIPTLRGEPSHRPKAGVRSIPVRPKQLALYGAAGSKCNPVAAPRRGQRPNRRLLPHPMQPIPGGTPGLKSKNRLPSLRERPPPMTAPPKPQNARKYCEFHEQSGHTTIECRKPKKALHELVDKGQIDRFLKRGSRFLRREQEPAQPQPRDKECLIEVVTIIGNGITRKNKQTTPQKNNEEKGGGYTLGCPLSSWPSSSEALTSVSRGLVASSPTPRPSPEGGVNPLPRGHGLHLSPTDARPHRGGKPQNSCPPETLELPSPRLCVNTLGAALLVTLLLRLGRPFRPCGRISLGLPLLAGFTGVQISLQLFSTPLVRSDKPLQSSAFHCSSHPSAKATSSSVTFGTSEAPGVAKSQDLTRSRMSENLAAKSALMKLVDGHWVIRGEPPAAWEATPTGRLVPEGRGCDPQMTGFSIIEGQTVRLPLPPLEKERMSRSRLDSPQSVAAYKPSAKFRDHEKGGTNKVINCIFLACWVTRRCLSSSHREVRSAPNIEVISIRTTNTLGKILKDQKGGCGEKEIVCKKLQLRLPITGLALPHLGALHRLNCLSHKLGDGPRLIVLPYVKLEVTGRLYLLSCGLPKWVPHRFTLVPVRNV
ncbi:LOW QUALITY PROTEIN: hypothetical protein Cgig2_006573 [Carnegiea gigantea]|uniref:Uncharacterized protein n=1 Tax=Carnegiea gigantea TaxID=171969 RepID=A0A9Q1JHZ6_9CARY|nr:LOW QUALITY PROTEIN: hypothetical protein Cgig2_006573 [Carnegiea gigantea]